MTRFMSGCEEATKGAKDLLGRTLANRFSDLRMVTLRLFTPPPWGVVMGAFRRTLLRRIVSQLSGWIPALWPAW